MAVEIERRFLVHANSVAELTKGLTGVPVLQGYLSSGNWMTRVRTMGEKGFLTVKSTGPGVSRQEFEYEIPLADAQSMLQGHGLLGRISKTRYTLPEENGLAFELDVFEGALNHLVIAEMELPSVETPVPSKPWMGPELTDLKAFSNEHLARFGLPESYSILNSAMTRQGRTG